MTALSLRGLPLPVAVDGTSIGPVPHGARVVSRDGTARTWRLAAPAARLRVTVGPMPGPQADFIEALVTPGRCETYPLATSQWSDSGIPSGMALAATPGAPLGGLSGVSPSPAGITLEALPALTSGAWSAAYWYSPTGTGWAWHVQSQGLCAVDGVLGGTQRVSLAGAAAHLAQGYYQGLMLVAAALPAEWVPLLEAGVGLAFAGELVAAPGVHQVELEDSRILHGYERALSLSLTP